MKVLMIARQTLNSSPGGDTIQIQSTAKYLAKIGIIVEIYDGENEIKYLNYDLIHFFNIIRPDDIVFHLRRTTLPFVISTIYVDYTEYERQRKGKLGFLASLINGDRMEYLKAIARYFKNGDRIKSFQYILKGHRQSIIDIANKTGALLPNSHNEYTRFSHAYVSGIPYFKIPNAIDKNIFDNDIAEDSRYKDHILCVGRIEGRKNQLNLIKALVGSNLKLTIIGKASPNHLTYFDECKRIISENGNMQLIEHISHSELALIFKAAKVHVLPSWFETTGLSTLEAAMMGCNIVITSKGDTKEYFGDMAYYCEPDDIKSIKEAVLLAYHAPVNLALKELILKEYTWERTAEETLKAYNFVLDKN